MASGDDIPATEDAVRPLGQRYFHRRLLGTKLSAAGGPGEGSWEAEVARALGTLRGSGSTAPADDARRAFLRALRGLTYGNALFFPVRRHTDPLGLLPEALVLGVNKNGLHFFRLRPREHLHSVELRDIMQFGSSTSGEGAGKGGWERHATVGRRVRIAGPTSACLGGPFGCLGGN